MTRFTHGEIVRHAGRPATIATVDASGDSPRYTIFYNDGDNGVVFHLLGRVIDKVEAK